MLCLISASFTGCIEDDDSPSLRDAVEDFVQASSDGNYSKLCGSLLDYDGAFITGQDKNDCLLAYEDEDLEYKHSINSFDSQKLDYKVNRDSGYVYSVSMSIEDCVRALNSMDEWSCETTTVTDLLWVKVNGKWGYGYEGLNQYYPADGESSPIATFFVSQDSQNIYHVEVIKISQQRDLEEFSYFLKDESGSTYVGGNGFGEIAMQIINEEAHGIDMGYSGDDEVLENRANNVSDDDGSKFPVHFSDNDRDGKLSAGDQFTIYGQGNSANGPAEDGWKLDIQYDMTGDIIGSAKLL